MNPSVVSYLDSQVTHYTSLDSEIAKQYSDIIELYKKKLWHQLTLKLEKFLHLPQFNQGRELITFYEKVIRDFESKINQLTFVHMIIRIAQQYTDLNESISFVEEISPKVAGHKEASILLRSEIISKKLKANRLGECKPLLETLKTELEGVTGIDTSVYEHFYLASAEYYKATIMPAEFYRSALLYLAYVPLDSLSEADRSSLAFDMGLAALVGENIYNFGELIAHPVLTYLNNTDRQWMIQLLQAFNTGNIDLYESLIQQFHTQLAEQPILVSNNLQLKKKIAITALMELVFKQSSINRTIPFETISVATKLSLNDVEYLVMKALSLKVVKGTIDQVEQNVYFTWVQPRVLNLEQVANMKTRLKDWSGTVHKTRTSMEDQTVELFS
eukprot:TRINITY_DN3097_c0_g1_i1.p1 TRINITY_DN3097_c0_g1~~TRINITY_DN3097_c0_g1_i1.p1  ORF type:complete len:387 (-),score=80.72 TRINITY_DN3097_c0_g1_i1:58-1218(-)